MGKINFHDSSITDGSRGSKFPLSITSPLLIIIIAVVSFAVYFNAIFDGFVYDDAKQVVGNTWIRSIEHIPEIFSKNSWAFNPGLSLSNNYVPMGHILYMLEYYIFGLQPWGFHLVHIMFHTGVSILVFVVTSRLLREYQIPSGNPSIKFKGTEGLFSPPFIAALLFATHPIHTETVIWITSKDHVFSFFYILSLYFYIRAGDRVKGGYLLSAASFFLAILFKETALTLPAIFLAYDYLFKKSGYRPSDILKRYLPFLAVLGGYLIMRFNALGGFAPYRQNPVELNAYQHVINIFPLFVQYIWKLLFPVNLNAFYVYHPATSLFDTRVMLSLIATAAFVVASFIAFRRSKLVFFCILLIIVPLLPAFYFRGLGVTLFAERYLYLPSVGFVILLSLLFAWVRSNYHGQAVPLIVGFALLIGLYSTGTLSRNAAWKDDYTLWVDTVKKSPDGCMPHFNLGKALADRGKIDEAIEQYRIALWLEPNFPDTHNNLGAAYMNLGLIDKAIEQYRIALSLNPDHAEAHFNLGFAFFKKGMVGEAIEQYRIGLQRRYDFPDVYNNLGAAYMSLGLIDKAIEQYRIALSLNPDHAEAHFNLGFAFFKKGMMREAIGQFQIALQHRYKSPDLYNNLGAAYMNLGLIDKAIEYYKIAVEMYPSDPVFRNNLMSAYKAMGSSKASIQ